MSNSRDVEPGGCSIIFLIIALLMLGSLTAAVNNVAKAIRESAPAVGAKK